MSYLVEETNPVGSYSWNVEIYEYDTETLLTSAEMAFWVEHTD